MIVDLIKNAPLFHGVAHLKQEQRGVYPSRMTQGLSDFYAASEHAFIRARSTSGVRLRMKTDSTTFRMTILFGRAARPMYKTDVRIDHQSQTLDPGENPERLDIDLVLPGKPVELEIALPPLVECWLQNPELDEKASVEAIPGKNKWLFSGDSIMQGMTVTEPGKSYAAILSGKCDAEWTNISVGGAVMRGEVGSLAAEYDWDTLFIGYGINNFNQRTPLSVFRAETERYLKEVQRKNADIFLLTPIPMLGKTRNEDGVELEEYRKILRECAEKYPKIRVVEGERLLPADPVYYIDMIHPNDSGAALFAENLRKEMYK